MNRLVIATGALLMLGALHTTSAHAQELTEPDIRNIRPVVMLLVDTSGSMERMSGGDGGALPMCSGSPTGTNQRNRWTTVLEALTGSWPEAGYYCDAIPRNTTSFIGQPDYRYYHPYHRPPLDIAQLNDGILDVYRDRVKFGLMTFDNTYTFRDAPSYVNEQLVPRTTFLSRLPDSISQAGEHSYADARALTFPGCETTFMVNTGARNESASMGAMVSVGSETDDALAINQRIQEVLLGVRPYGATPTSSLLDDFRYYVGHHSDVTSADPFSACRSRYALLLTDGQPDAEFRDARFDCAAVGGCPYERASTIVSDLCQYDSASEACTGDVDGVFVVAFDTEDAAALAELNDIASVGGTGEALLASNREELLSRIGDVLDRAAPGTTTRTRPAFISGGGSALSSSGPSAQLEFNAGFQVGDADTPWTGVLERTRYVCNEELVPEPEPPGERVRFDQVLNARTTDRELYTVLTEDPADLTGNLIGTQADAVPLGATTPDHAISGLGLVKFDTSTVTPAHLGLGGSSSARESERNRIVKWVHGTTPDREGARMGDIYHSSPVVVGPPILDIADESYNLFREKVADRPTVVYVGTNDGVLHAFVAEDWQDPSGGGERYEAGHELWGFIPPVLLPKLQSATSSHQIMLDGTAVVRDIFYRRSPTDAPDGDIYHTVLLMGFRGGAPGYFALDVTDPTDPIFLWQYVGEQSTGRGRGGRRNTTPLGYSYGRPAIGQVLVEIDGRIEERAVALLPGGSGSLDEEEVRTSGPIGCPAQGRGQPPVTGGTTNARSRQRCWSNRGRVLTWVDIVTGEVIQAFDEDVFGAPLTGGVAMYPGDVGTVAERAFFTDADGIVWSVDFSKRDPAEWSVRQVHDIFWDAGATEGQPAYDPPIVSVDHEGNLVVLIATGDIDRLDGSAQNRVVSLTEERTLESGDFNYQTELNWEVRLHEGEQVTGQLELFEGKVYFASFESGADPSNACAMGQSRIWALDYLETAATPPSGYVDAAGAFPKPGFESLTEPGVYDRYFMGPFENQLVLGVGVTQRPTCILGAFDPDPYIERRYRVNQVGGGGFELTAQVSGGPSLDGGAIATVSVALPTPPSFTQVTGFAGRVDY